jgi:hypothetical protein
LIGLAGDFFNQLRVVQTANLMGDIVAPSIMTWIFIVNTFYMMLRHISGEKIKGTMFFSMNNMFWPILVFISILSALSIAVLAFFEFGPSPWELILQSKISPTAKDFLIFGLYLSIIPFVLLNIFLGIILYMTMLLMIDKKLSILQALKIAYLAISKKWLKNIIITFLQALFYIVGFLLSLVSLGIGFIWLFPMMSILYAVWYKEIFGSEVLVNQTGD